MRPTDDMTNAKQEAHDALPLSDPIFDVLFNRPARIARADQEYPESLKIGSTRNQADKSQ